MSYIINKRNGTQLTTVLEGTTDTTATSLTLVGQNYIGWGEIFQENLVHLMENFARSALPANALVGQLWFDTNAKSLKVLVAEDTWRPLATSASGTLPPETPNVGDFWYDTNTRQVKVWNSTVWQIVGPVYTSTQGPTGANAISIADNLNTPRHVVSLESRGATFAIFNPYTEFLTLNDVPGFGNSIPRGFSFRSNISSDTLFHGTVENAMTLQGLSSDVFVRGDQDDITTGNLNIINNGGLWLGEQSEARITYEPTTNNVIFAVSKDETNFKLTGLYDGGEKTMLQSNVQTGMLTVYGNPVDAMGISTKNYTDTTVTQAEQRQNTNLVSNVNAINNTLGTLTTEINRVNNYAQNLDVIKADLESPTFTGVPIAPTAAAGTSTTQVATTAFVQQAVAAGIPIGGIVLWSGAVNNIPLGWALCNGSNGTPDLRNRFIVGAGDGYNVGSTGGSADSVVVAHTHTTSGAGAATGVINSSPLGDFGEFVSASGIVTLSNQYPNRSQGAAGVGSYGVATITIPNHAHTVESTGQSGVNTNLPPYYALAYIMKTA